MSESSSSSNKWPGFVFVAAAALGLGVSALLAVEYATPDPKFCSGGGGCEVVRFSSYSHVGPIPVPALGLLFFASLLVAFARVRSLLLPLASIGALVSVVFIVLQAAVIQAVCPYCIAADAAAIIALAAVIEMRRTNSEPVLGRTGVAVAGIALFVPAAYGAGVLAMQSDEGPLPEVVAAEQREGVATIVEFLDFQCPYCRKQHVAMKDVIGEYGERVRVVYKHVPLPGHTHAAGAARAATCADEQGKEAEMADGLLTREDITPLGCEQLAASLALDMEAYRACVASDRPDSVLEADFKAAESAEVRGLPTFFIGARRFEGLQRAGTVRAAIEQAL